MNPRIVKATLTISCDISVDDIIKKQAEEECNRTLLDEELAQKILFAFLNPKIEIFNDEEDTIIGHWDMVCNFNGRLKNFKVSE